MTRKPDEWMPLHVRKYLGDTMHLTRDQHGAYMLLLMAYWMRGGPLTANDNELAAIARASKAEWAKLKPAIMPFFTLVDGKLVQKRAEEELTKAKRLTDAKAEAGAKGGRTKWGSDLEQQNSGNRSERLAAARQLATHTALEWEVMASIFGCCVRCGVVEKLVKDHIVPIYQGGSDGLENIQPLCRSCNASKGSEAVDHRDNALQSWRERLAKCLAETKQTPAPLPLPLPVDTSLRSVSPPQAAVTVRPEIPPIPDCLKRPRAKPQPKGEPEGFPAFYDAYPLHRARPMAAKSYAAALKRTTPDVLLAGACRYAQSRKDEDSKFTKHPATWLNNDCWLDQEVSNETRFARTKPPSAHDQFFAAGASVIRDILGETDPGDDSLFAHQVSRPLLSS